jgi:hypothetical protein
MRERTIPVKKEMLESLSDVYRPSKIAKSLNISKQRWHNYKSGRHDVPESILDTLCAQFKIDKNDLVLSS